MSAIPLLAITLSALIIMATTVAATTSLSSGLLLNNNNNIKLVKKNISSNEPKVSHKFGNGGLGRAAAGNNNNKIKSINDDSTKKLNVSPKLGGSSRSAVSSRRFNIALIKPTFTAAAYDSAFYKFYFLFIHTFAGMNVTTHLNLLSSRVNNQLTALSSSASTLSFLPRHLKTLLPQSNINVLTDADVDSGSPIFVKNGITSNRYDILIVGHEEYVTQKEYDNLKQFVANGGTLIVLDGNAFFAQIKYNSNTDIITLVKGHGWAFNGESAWRSVNERWRKETSQWLGSNYLCYSCKITFLNNPFGYKHHEEQYLTNPNDMILMNYNAVVMSTKKYHPPVAKPVIATYQLNYQKGRVIVLGLYSDDVISNGNFDKFFDGLLLQHTLSLEPPTRNL
ncbi:MAG: N,N-dimethylformamidase beta subunit family domain-containing protein [Nitrososphaeraceae archaeon]